MPCLYPLFQCDSTESELWDQLVIGAYPANTTVVEFGRDDTRDVLLNVPSTHEIDGNIYDVVGYEISSVSNVPLGLDVNLATGDVIAGGDVHCLEFTGTAMQEGIYDLDVVGVLYLGILGLRPRHHHDAPFGDAECDRNRRMCLSLSRQLRPAGHHRHWKLPL